MRIKAKTVGVFAADRIPVILERPAAIVINTDEHSKPGTHWVALYINKYGDGTYFDSYGMPPINLHHTKRIKRNCSRIIWNQNQIQGFSTKVCGQYCVVFLYHMSCGGSLNKFCSFFTNSYAKNDRLILSMYKKIIISNKCKNHVKKFPNDNCNGSGVQICKSLL